MTKLRVEITERDQKIFNLLKKFGCVREDILANYLGFNYSLSTSKVTLSKLSTRLKTFIIKEKLIFGKPFYWYLDKKGCEITGVDKPKKPNLINLNHDDFVTEFGVNMVLNGEDIDLITEYELKQELYGKEAKQKKIPDLILNGKTAIEIELTRKDDRRIASIINNYSISSFSEIIYYTNSISVINGIYKYTKNNDKFKFRIFKDSILKSEEYLFNNVSSNNNNNNNNDYDDFMQQLISRKKRD